MGRVAVSDFPEVGVAQAAELTGLSKDAIRGRIRRGRLASTVHEGRHRIPLAELRGRGLVVEGERYMSALERAESLEAELSAALEGRERARRELLHLRVRRAGSGIRWPWRRGGSEAAGD